MHLWHKPAHQELLFQEPRCICSSLQGQKANHVEYAKHLPLLLVQERMVVVQQVVACMPRLLLVMLNNSSQLHRVKQNLGT